MLFDRLNDYLKDPRSQRWLIGGLVVLTFLVLWLALQRPPRQQPAPGPLEPSRREPLERGEVDLKKEVARFTSEPTLTLYDNRTGERRQVKLEEYLVGVVGGEIGKEFPKEAIAAQAIVARTFTLEKLALGSACRDRFQADACTDPKLFQAYNPDNVNDRVRQAVKETRGQILVYNGGFVRGYFSSHNGGVAATAEESFPFAGELPYLQPVRSPDAEYAPEERSVWQATFSREELARAVGTSAARVDHVRIIDRGPSGRAIALEVGDKKILGPTLRAKLGPNRLNSTLITDIDQVGENFVFHGKGWGHGAGLSQWGAYGFAAQGWDALRIVEHFYRGAKVVRLYD